MKLGNPQKAIDERVILNFCDKNVVIARFRDKNVIIASFRDKNEAFILALQLFSSLDSYSIAIFFYCLAFLFDR